MTTLLKPLAYSLNDAIAVSSIKRTRLYALIKSQKLKVTKVGRRTLLDAESLRALVAGGAL